jgi:sensor histidine kinase YesM
LQLTVEDDGRGLGAATAAAGGGTGVGLGNVRERLTAQFGRDADLAIAGNAAGGTTVTLHLPLAGHA